MGTLYNMPGLRAAARLCRSISRRFRRLKFLQLIFLIVVSIVILHEVLQNRSQRQWASFIEKEAEWNNFEKLEKLKKHHGKSSKSRIPRSNLTRTEAPGGDIFKKHREFIKTSTTKKTPIVTTTEDNIPFFNENKNTPKYDKPPCRLSHKDALSAIDRAKTQQCKIELADVSCRHQNDLQKLQSEKTKL